MAEPTSGNQLAQQFQACRPAFCAIGDETRQLILRVFIENCGTGGLRVGELQASTNLSRAAVSHHLKVLKDAGIITFRREGTKNYYYLDSASSSLLAVSELLQDAVRQMKHCPTYQEEGEHKLGSIKSYSAPREAQKRLPLPLRRYSGGRSAPLT